MGGAVWGGPKTGAAVDGFTVGLVVLGAELGWPLAIVGVEVVG